MKHTKRTYNKNKTHYKKRRSHKKTKKIFFNKHKKTRKQSGSGKYKPNDIYNIDQFMTNNCLSTLKIEKKPSEKGMVAKMFKSSDPYLKCRRSMRVFNTEKMPQNEYLKYRKMIEYAKDNEFYSTERGTIEDIGNNYIFDYIFGLHGKRSGGGTTALQNLLQVISPCYLIKVLTLDNYYYFVDHLAEKSKIKKEQGKYGASITSGLKRRVDIENIYNWVKDTNFELFKLKSPQDLIDLFNSFYPINCPYREELKEFERIKITATQLQETNNRYVNNSSWDLYLNINFDDFYNDYLLKTQYRFEKVYGEMLMEAFERPLSTNIIGSTGEIVFKSTDTFEDAGEQNFSKVNEHFNNFILKLNELGGIPKFVNNSAVSSDGSEVKVLEHNIISNPFVKKIVQFLAVSMVPQLVKITRFWVKGMRDQTKSVNYYGLFYHYYEENYDIDSMYFAENILFDYSTSNKIRFEENEVEIINRFINSNIPNNNYDKCVGDLRKYQPNNLFPTCRIIDIQNNSFSSILFFDIVMPTVVPSQPPYPTLGYCVQITKVNNILDDDIQNNNVTVTAMVLWSGNISSIFNANLPNGEEVKLPLEKAIPMFTGNTFYNGFIQPILSSLKPNIRVNSTDSTPRNTMAQMDMPLVGVSRDSNESIGSTVVLG
jgi:hypothetical protein